MKLLIVEDEKLSRETLADIPWSTINIEVIATAANGDEAFDIIKINRPDIIISYIRMSGGSGIDLAEKLYRLMPDIRIIFLTAYNNFEYAKKAIDYGVCNFLLKPINIPQVLDAVKQVSQELLTKRAQKMDFEKLSRQMESSRYFLKSYFFSILSSNNKDALKFFNITDENIIFSTIVIHFNNNGISESDCYGAFENINSIIKCNDYEIISFYDQMILTFILAYKYMQSEADVLTSTLNAAEVVQEYLEFNSKEFTIGVGQIVKGAQYIELSHKRACEAIKYEFYLGRNKVIYINDIEPAKPSTDYKNISEEKYIDAVKIGDEQSAIKILNDIFETFKKEHVDIETVQRVCLELFVEISTVISLFGQNPNILFNKTDIWTVLKSHQTILSLQKLVTDITLVAISQLCLNRESKNNDLIKKVKKIVNENYANDISLNEIAKQVYISPSYLSVIFSNETKTTFKNYIMQTRIEKAKELLEKTDMNIYEIAEKVGYKNQKYFSFLFHKLTGLMPTEYRRIKNV